MITVRRNNLMRVSAPQTHTGISLVHHFIRGKIVMNLLPPAFWADTLHTRTDRPSRVLDGFSRPKMRE